MYQFSVPWKIAMEGKGKKRPFLSCFGRFQSELFHASAHHPFGFAFRSKLAAATLMLIVISSFS